MTLIILSDGRKVPVEGGYTIERICEILREVGHTPDHVVLPDSSTHALESKAA